jgi:NTE family protein
MEIMPAIRTDPGHDPVRRAGGGVEPVGLVLAGGGARGAYELGVLSELLPALDARGERPRVIVGTSVGALNAAFLAATAEQPVERVVERGLRIWNEIGYGQVLAPLASPGSLRRALCYLGQFLGIDDARLYALLDPAPLRDTLSRTIAFDAIERNVAAGALHDVGVVATSAATSRSVVFHHGGERPERDDRRGIDYVFVRRLTDVHVRASAAIPGAFPAVRVSEPPEAAGWYFDGGVRLNTAIKPALKLGAQRVVVVALNAIVPSAGPPEHRPDALEGAGQLVQALLVDPLAHDVETLATINRVVGDDEQRAGKRRVPYIFVAPGARDAIGRLARQVFRDHYHHLADALRSRDLALLGCALDADSDPAHAELLSYLFFAPELARELIALGAQDARRWIEADHDEGLWQVGPLGR